MIKQLYSIIQLDEAIKTMEADADNIGLLIACRCTVLTRFMRNAVCAGSRWF